MPIAYRVSQDGHFISAVARGTVTAEQFIDYEVAHAIDSRITPPVFELFEIEHNACQQITKEDMSKVLDQRCKVKKLPTPHRCALVVSTSDIHMWELAKFYEGMVMLHSPETVIVFGEQRTARVWLGIHEE
jgi:hypothetical protein